MAHLPLSELLQMCDEQQIPPFHVDSTALNRTEAAFMARQIDSSLARALRLKGLTFQRLQQQAAEDLRALGLSEESIGLVKNSGRPAIPFQTLINVLISNRFACCVCHDVSKAIIVHHIRPWAVTHDHGLLNLAVLCTECHVKAHSVSTLTRNLDPVTLVGFKSDWERKVQASDAAAIVDASRSDSSAWWYFNHRRLFELAKNLHVPLTQISERYRSSGLVDEDGRLKPRPQSSMYMYSGGEGMILYAYVLEVLHEVLDGLSVRNISDSLDASILGSVLKDGDFVFVQGAHVFRSETKTTNGPDQPCFGRRRANNTEVTFKFDRWEATSMSAFSHLGGRRSAGSILRVVNIERREGRFSINGSVLAIAAAFYGLKNRDYDGSIPYTRTTISLDDEEDFDFD